MLTAKNAKVTRRDAKKSRHIGTAFAKLEASTGFFGELRGFVVPKRKFRLSFASLRATFAFFAVRTAVPHFHVHAGIPRRTYLLTCFLIGVTLPFSSIVPIGPYAESLPMMLSRGL